MNWWVEWSGHVSATVALGGFELYKYGLLIGVGLIAGIWASDRILKSKENDEFWLWLILGGLIGARIYHVLDKWSYYLHHLSEIWDLRRGGLGIFGAIIGVVLTIWVYCLRRKLDVWPKLQRLVITAPLAQAIGRWGNFFNMEGFGPPTDLPWKIFIRSELRPVEYVNYSFFHPVFLYESLLDMLLFYILWRKVNSNSAKASVGTYMIGYGLIRMCIEVLRLDTWVIYGFKVAFMFSVILILAGVCIIRSQAKE